MTMLTHSVLQPTWRPIAEPMTTDQRLLMLSQPQIELVQRVLKRQISAAPYDRQNPMDQIEVILARLHLGPTHEHIQKGTQLRQIGYTKRKGYDNDMIMYETPCRIVFVMPSCDFMDRTQKL